MSNFIHNKFSSFKCTICSCFVDEANEHPSLKVSICKTCSDALEPSEKNEDCCLWCGQCNVLLSCITCVEKCCFKCINRNLGPHYLNKLNEKNWSCFVCDPTPIKGLQEEHLKSLTNEAEASIVPEGAESTTDICSPIIFVDENQQIKKKQNAKQDLDFILNIYDKQIRESLELEDANIPAIIKEINSIKPHQLSSAIYSYKRCLTAFASDLTNLEARMAQANASETKGTLIKLTSLLKILIQHHIFNRICHPQARMKDDRSASLTDRHRPSFLPFKKLISSEVKSNQSLIIDPALQSDAAVTPQIVERKDKDVNEMVSKIKDLYSKQRPFKSSDDEDFEPSEYNKRLKLAENEEKISRLPRSLATPSWLSDFKIEKENDMLESDIQEMIVDEEWSCGKIKRFSGTGKRGRPPKFSSFCEQSFSSMNFHDSGEDSSLKRGRGRPRKAFINVKEPRYYVQKKNGENLISSP